MSDLFAHSLNVRVLFDKELGTYQLLALRARVQLETISRNENSTFARASGFLELQHEIG